MTTPTDQPTISLNDSASIPQLGFGVWQVPDDGAERAVSEALEAGYRHIDTAMIYGNEAGVGRAIASSGLPREDIYVTTKLWNTDQGDHASVSAACRASLERLGLERVDLYLIHWAAPSQGRYVQTWEAMTQLRSEGLARSVGVSNFEPEHLQRVIEATDVVPAVNQVELHPYLQQESLRAVDASLHIATEAYSPLASGHGLLEDPVLGRIAAEREITVAQAVLAWHLAKGNIVIPKSVTPERIAANLEALEVSLEPEDITAIDGLDRGQRFNSDPNEV